MEWRDRLIVTVYVAYPPGTAKKSVGSHFEDTVGMVLGWLDPVGPATLHRSILRVMDRGPAPYFVT